MLTLYFAPGACSMAAHIVLEESGEKYEPKQVDLAKGEQRTDTYLKADVSHMEAALVERMRQQLMWTFGAMVSGLGVGMGIAAAISQAIG